MKKTIIITIIKHRSQSVFALSFKYDRILKEICKDTGAKWSYSKGVWYYPLKDIKLNKIIVFFEKKAILDLNNITKIKLLKTKSVPLKALLNKEQKNHLNKFYIYLKGKRFSISTLKTYSYLVAEYVIYKNKHSSIDLKSMEEHAENVIVVKNKSISTHRQFISAMKHYLAFINSSLEIDFKSLAPKKEKKLPNVLSKEEIIRLIQVTKNLKHRVCITLLYSSGLRIGELLNLKLMHLDFDRMLLKVVQGKNKKDRYIPIAKSIMPMLTNYLMTFKPNVYLIENDIKKTVYSPESIRAMLKRKLKDAQITKKVTPHTLRHSYATHLLESGVDIRYIQTLLGHSKPETTMIYTHVTSQELQKINNPLDLIVKQLNNSDKKLN